MVEEICFFVYEYTQKDEGDLNGYYNDKKQIESKYWLWIKTGSQLRSSWDGLILQ